MTREDWVRHLGFAGWRKITAACECGPSVDFAEMATVKALNAAVELGFTPPPPVPLIADCSWCGPVTEVIDEHFCPWCAETVVFRETEA